jgi:ribosomal protein L24E
MDDEECAFCGDLIEGPPVERTIDDTEYVFCSSYCADEMEAD